MKGCRKLSRVTPEDKKNFVYQDKVREFGEKVGIQGVQNWLSHKHSKTYRIAHLIVWLGFLAYALHLISKNAIRFSQYNIKVSMREEDVASVAFPSLTICPSHTWRRSRVAGERALMWGFLAPVRPDLPRSVCYDPNVTNYNAISEDYWRHGSNIRSALGGIPLRALQDTGGRHSTATDTEVIVCAIMRAIRVGILFPKPDRVYILETFGFCEREVDIEKKKGNFFIETVKGMKKSFREGMDFLWIPFSDFFLSCWVLGEKFDCKDLFFGHYTANGRCFTFNYRGEVHSTKKSLVWKYSNHSQKVFNVSRSGAENSVRLELALRREEYCMGERDDKLAFRLLLHDPLALPPFMDDSILLAPGQAYEVAVSQIVKDKREVENLGECASHKDLPLYRQFPYTRHNCLLQCLAELAFQNCSCLLRYCPISADTMQEELQKLYPDAEPLFFWNEYYPCFINQLCEMKLIKRYRTGKDGLASYCLDRCPDACYYSTYKTRVTSAPFISSMNEKRLENMTGYTGREELERNVLEVSVFMDSLRISVVREAWDFCGDELISNLGGTLGLFLGASLFSFVELADFLAALIAHFCRTSVKEKLPKRLSLKKQESEASSSGS